MKTNLLLSWLESPSTKTGLRFFDENVGWSRFNYESIARGAFGIQSALMDLGVRQNDVICVLLPTGPSVVGALFGVWLAGGVVTPLAPPVIFEDESEYVEHAARVFDAAKPRVIITSSEYSVLVERGLRLVADLTPSVIYADDCNGCERSRCPTARNALLQFTSGSSGSPRGVLVEFENLLSNIQAIRTWIRMTAEDVSVTWLPLYHDMGLIGCLFTPSTIQGEVWIMRPEQFVRYPDVWLKVFGKDGGTLSAGPNFGYAYAARRVAPEQLVGCDFSAWRVAIAGAEPIDLHALRLFSSLVGPLGFSERAFMPAYGLAEATLAVTGVPLEDVPRAVLPDWGRLCFGAPVVILESGRIDAVGAGAESGWLVSSGRPHLGNEVKIVDVNGEVLPVGAFGEIAIRGPAITAGYHDGKGRGATRFDGEWLISGDAGFVLEGEYFVVGRIAESLKVHGRSIYAEDVEARLAAATGLGKGRCVVVAVAGADRGLLVVGEGVDSEWAKAASQFLRAVVGEGVSIRIVSGRRGVIRRTSSGKPRRRLMWELYQSGRLEFESVFELPSGG